MPWLGRPLDPPLRAWLEAFFAVDLAAVRVHRGRGARVLTRLLRASAVAFGRRLFFSPEGARRLDGHGVAGAALLAHEVAHVLQYRRHGFFGMLGRYVAEYLRGRRHGGGHDAAYRGIGFEREAFAVGERVARALRGDAEALAALRDGREPPLSVLERAAAARFVRKADSRS